MIETVYLWAFVVLGVVGVAVMLPGVIAALRNPFPDPMGEIIKALQEVMAERAEKEN